MKIEMHRLTELVKEVTPLFRDKERAAMVQTKGVADFVTQVDFQVQEYMKNRLAALYPEIQFMGEEKNNEEIDFPVRSGFWTR